MGCALIIYPFRIRPAEAVPLGGQPYYRVGSIWSRNRSPGAVVLKGFGGWWRGLVFRGEILFGQVRCPRACGVREAGIPAPLWRGMLESGAPLRRDAGGFGLDGRPVMESRSCGSALVLISRAGSSPWIVPTGKVLPHFEQAGLACHSCTAHSCTAHPHCSQTISGHISPFTSLALL